MSNIKIDVETFLRRIKKFYQAWKSGSPSEWAQMDAFFCGVGVMEDMMYSKSTTLQVWLVGYELTDTVMLFTESAIFFLASRKKIDFLRTLEAAANKANTDAIPAIKLLVRDKTDNDKKNFEALLEGVRESHKGQNLGVFSKDQKFPGPFMDAWRAYYEKNQPEGLQTMDVSHLVTVLMAPKEEGELGIIKKACQVTSDVFSKYLKEQIMDIIDNDKKVKHSKLGEGVEKALSDKKYVPNLDTGLLESCYPAIVQSGGNYKLKFSVVSDKEYVHFGAIICSFGARYRSYCSNIVRTMLVDPSEKIQRYYSFLTSVEEHLLSRLKDGAILGDVYDSTVSLVKKEHPELEGKLTKNFGFSMGIEFRDASIQIAANSKAKAKKGMTFNVNVGFSNLNGGGKDRRSKEVALFVGDTVLVGENTPAQILTSSKKKIKNIAIFLKDAEEESEEEKENKKGNLPDPDQFGRGKRTAVLDQKLRTDSTAEERRKKHQKELMDKVNEEGLRRIMNKGKDKEQVKARKAPVSYKSPGQLPRESEVKQLKIYVDKKYETIIMPIFGVPVPFHIATVKNISQSVEGDYTYLRINFFHPGASIGKDTSGGFNNPDATFLKELTYRSTNVREPGEISAPSSNLNTAFRLIKDIQKRFKTREAEDKEKADLVQQDTLVISQGKGNPKLKDLYIRPNIAQKRLSGVLEAHTNGFRYTSIRGDKVDILYNNIKHAFFQPCDGEMIILLHFHLKNPILFGKKKQSDLQFYTEVGEITTDLGKHQHMHDRDDLAAEQAERELRHKLKQAFKGFCDKVTAVTKTDLEFDVPFRELGFHGVPHRETVLLQPTDSCLVSLSTWPPFVVSLREIQLIHFERVQFQLKNFDMVFVFQDTAKKVMMVTTIPMNMLDNVKEWLNSMDIKYTEGIQSLNWVKIMKTITDDPEGFYESGGWKFLDQNSDAEGDGDETEDSEDEEFKVSDGSDDDVDEESDEDYSSAVSEESFSEEELDSDESSGKDWSDLEREAAEDDEDLDSDQDRGRGRGGGGSSSSKHRSKSSRSPAKKHKSSHSSHSSRHGHSDKRKRESSGSSSRHKSSKKSKR